MDDNGSTLWNHEFPTPSIAEWTERVRADLRDRPPAELNWRTEDFDLPALLTARDLRNLPHLNAGPALPPPARGCAVRERVAAASPAAAAEQIRCALAQDVDQLELRLDSYFFDAAPEEPGMCGIPIADASDLATVLEPVDLAAARTVIAIDGDATIGLAFLLQVADQRGVAPEQLRGELGFEPLQGVGQLAEPSLDATRWDEGSALLGHCLEHTVNLVPLAVDARWSHAAGASPAQELGYLLAEIVEVVRQLQTRGHTPAQILGALSCRVPVGPDLLTQIAKLRSLRLLWGKVAAAYLPAGVAIPDLPITAYSSERTRARRHDLRTNLLRGALEAVAATLGGCGALCLQPFEAHPDYQDEDARALARHQHQLLRDESALHRVIDPTAGSFTIEALTHELATAAWTTLQDIEARGGILAALQSGFLLEQIIRTGSQRLGRVRRRDEVLIGISRYVGPTLEGAPREHTVDRGDHIRAVEHQLASRAAEEPARTAALTALRAAPPHGLIDAARAAAAAGCTGQEIADALDDAAADHAAADHAESAIETAAIPEAEDVAPEMFIPDATDFEELRDMVAEGGAPRSLVLVAGDGRAHRAAAEFGADLLRAGGFDLVGTERITGPGEASAAVARTQAELVLLCVDDADLTELSTALTAPGQQHPAPALAVAAAGAPAEPLGEPVDACLFAGGDVLIRLDYLAKVVELRRLGAAASNGESEPQAELRQSLESTLQNLRDCIRREEG